MRNTPCKTKWLTGLLACGLALLSLVAWADIRITQIETDGRVQDVATVEARSAVPVSIHSTVRSLRFHFTEADSSGRPTARLRYKLEGHDETRLDLPVKMRAVIYFRDRGGQEVGSSEFYLTGETPGWRSTDEASDFKAQREVANAPARTASARLSFISHSGNEGIGLFGADAVHLRIEQVPGKPHKAYDLSVVLGTDLAHPLGTPADWVREGLRAELAVLLKQTTPTLHSILAIQDDSPFFFGNWPLNAFIPVAPSSQVTLEWQTAHSRICEKLHVRSRREIISSCRGAGDDHNG